MNRKALRLLDGSYAVVRLAPDDEVPDWASGPAFVSTTRTESELSIVCASDLVPDGVRAERPLSCFEVEGPLDFSEIGVLASIAQPLAAAGISIFVLSTYDTDYVFVAARDCERAIHVLAVEGREISRS